MKKMNAMKDDIFYRYSPIDDIFYPVDNNELVDELQDDIEYWYLPRPIFEDGQPAQFGDKVLYNDEEFVIESIQCVSGGVWWLNDDYHVCSYEFLRRPSYVEDDTQAQIDEDAKLDVIAYRMKYNLDHNTVGEHEGITDSYRVMIDHLLERQRKVDGVE